mmetsp:Transcript_150035/g.482230  ORF Transcript_150035/g.482230 Transcript_150035/m.482230 type:complete len:246 (-) Transcript_150035:1149-1886(-)
MEALASCSAKKDTNHMVARFCANTGIGLQVHLAGTNHAAACQQAWACRCRICCALAFPHHTAKLAASCARRASVSRRRWSAETAAGHPAVACPRRRNLKGRAVRRRRPPRHRSANAREKMATSALCQVVRKDLRRKGRRRSAGTARGTSWQERCVLLRLAWSPLPVTASPWRPCWLVRTSPMEVVACSSAGTAWRRMARACTSSQVPTSSASCNARLSSATTVDGAVRRASPPGATRRCPSSPTP